MTNKSRIIVDGTCIIRTNGDITISTTDGNDQVEVFKRQKAKDGINAPTTITIDGSMSITSRNQITFKVVDKQAYIDAPGKICVTAKGHTSVKFQNEDNTVAFKNTIMLELPEQNTIMTSDLNNIESTNNLEREPRAKYSFWDIAGCAITSITALFAITLLVLAFFIPQAAAHFDLNLARQIMVLTCGILTFAAALIQMHRGAEREKRHLTLYTAALAFITLTMQSLQL